MTESEKTAKQKEKEAKKKAEKEAKLEKLRLKQQKQEEAKKAKVSKVCSLSTFSCTNSPNQFGCFILNIIIKWIFVFVTPLCPVNTFFRQQLWCVLLVYGMDKVLTLSFFGLLMHYPSSGGPKRN